MAHRQLTSVHRQFMARMLAEGRSHAHIAQVLGVHRSTIGRELQRNVIGSLPYCPKTAQYLADLRSRGHGHQGSRPDFEPTLRHHHRQRERDRSLLLRNPKRFCRPEKREAWQRFCLRWKKQLRLATQYSKGSRFRKTEMFRFRRRMALPREKRFWPFSQRNTLKLRWKKLRFRWAANRFCFRQPKKANLPQPLAPTVLLPSERKPMPTAHSVFFPPTHRHRFFPAFSRKAGSVLPLLFRQLKKGAFNQEIRCQTNLASLFLAGFSLFVFPFLKFPSAIG